MLRSFRRLLAGVPLSPLLIWIASGIILGLVAATVLLPTHVLQFVLSEAGPVEKSAIPAWLLLGFAILILVRPATRASIAGAILCAFAAAREADLHVALTDYSVLKVGFYIRSEHALEHQIIAGILVIVLIASGVVLARALIQQVQRSRGEVADWQAGAVFVLLVLIATKMFDRAPAVIEESPLGYALRPRAFTMFLALEEVFESLLPLFIIGVVISFVRFDQRRGALQTVPARRSRAAPRITTGWPAAAPVGATTAASRPFHGPPKVSSDGVPGRVTAAAVPIRFAASRSSVQPALTEPPLPCRPRAVRDDVDARGLRRPFSHPASGAK